MCVRVCLCVHTPLVQMWDSAGNGDRWFLKDQAHILGEGWASDHLHPLCGGKLGHQVAKRLSGFGAGFIVSM